MAEYIASNLTLPGNFVLIVSYVLKVGKIDVRLLKLIDVREGQCQTVHWGPCFEEAALPKEKKDSMIPQSICRITTNSTPFPGGGKKD